MNLVVIDLAAKCRGSKLCIIQRGLEAAQALAKTIHGLVVELVSVGRVLDVTLDKGVLDIRTRGLERRAEHVELLCRGIKLRHFLHRIFPLIVLYPSRRHVQKPVQTIDPFGLLRSTGFLAAELALALVGHFASCLQSEDNSSKKKFDANPGIEFPPVQI